MEAATSTFALLEKAKTGDDEALSSLFEQYRRRLIVPQPHLGGANRD